MPAEDYFVATDLHALRMQSELLALENTYLKGRVMGLEQDLRQLKEREAKTAKELTRLRERAKAKR